jgi:hypothetical protein
MCDFALFLKYSSPMAGWWLGFLEILDLTIQDKKVLLMCCQ